MANKQEINGRLVTAGVKMVGNELFFGYLLHLVVAFWWSLVNEVAFIIVHLKIAILRRPILSTSVIRTAHLNVNSISTCLSFIFVDDDWRKYIYGWNVEIYIDDTMTHGGSTVMGGMWRMWREQK